MQHSQLIYIDPQSSRNGQNATNESLQHQQMTNGGNPIHTHNGQRHLLLRSLESNNAAPHHPQPSMQLYRVGGNDILVHQATGTSIMQQTPGTGYAIH
jgi:hypothetical protein